MCQSCDIADRKRELAQGDSRVQFSRTDTDNSEWLEQGGQEGNAILTNVTSSLLCEAFTLIL